MDNINVYLIDLDATNFPEDFDPDKTSDKDWVELSENQGNVYSLKGFAFHYNLEEMSYNTFIRFLNKNVKY